MTDEIYLDELEEAYHEVRRTSWILADRMEYFGERAREEYEQAQKEFDELTEAYARQEGVEDVQALRKAFSAYMDRQRKIDEAREHRTSENEQRFYNDVDRLSEADEQDE